jgi:hypothetical protein
MDRYTQGRDPGDESPEVRWDLTDDYDALTCRHAFIGMIGNKALFRSIGEWILESRLTDAEWEEVWSKVGGYGPAPYEDTWEAAQERIKNLPSVTEFWRNPV